MAKTYQVLTDESIEKIKKLIDIAEMRIIPMLQNEEYQTIADVKAIIADVES